MKTYQFYFSLLILLTIFSCSQDEVIIEDPEPDDFKYEFTQKHLIHDLTGVAFPYSFFEPRSMDESTEKYPLIIALHGTEYYLKTESEFLDDPKTGYIALAWIEENNQIAYPAYVVAPNLNTEIWTQHTEYIDGWTDDYTMDFIEKLLDHLILNYTNIDSDRIYLTGHSMGGGATWYLGAKMKDQLAAIVPFAQSYSTNNTEFNTILSNIDNDDFINLPIWEFIHKNDDVGGATTSRIMFTRLQDKGYSPVYTHFFDDQNINLSEAAIVNEIQNRKRYFYTEYGYNCGGGECHYVMTKALKEEYLFEWLFSQKT